MQHKISGIHMNVGQSLESHVSKNLDHQIKKFYPDGIISHSIFSKAPHQQFQVELHIHIGYGGQHITAKGIADDPYTAFDAASEKLMRQMTKQHEKMNNRHKMKRAKEEIKDKLSVGMDIIGHDVVPQKEEDAKAPTIVAEKADMPRFSMTQAVARLEGGEKLCLFRNVNDDSINIVYWRTDGHIGWVQS